jgi:hypothetical protein
MSARSLQPAASPDEPCLLGSSPVSAGSLHPAGPAAPCGCSTPRVLHLHLHRSGTLLCGDLYRACGASGDPGQLASQLLRSSHQDPLASYGRCAHHEGCALLVNLTA